jgi:hypothetical protein
MIIIIMHITKFFANYQCFTFVEVQVVTAANTMTTVFCDVARCSLVETAQPYP